MVLTVRPSAPPPGATQATASAAYLALARLRRVDARLALSAADIRALEPLAAAWFTCGVDADRLTQASRQASRLRWAPPRAAGSARGRRLLAERTACGRPGAPEALHD